MSNDHPHDEEDYEDAEVIDEESKKYPVEVVPSRSMPNLDVAPYFDPTRPGLLDIMLGRSFAYRREQKRVKEHTQAVVARKDLVHQTTELGKALYRFQNLDRDLDIEDREAERRSAEAVDARDQAVLRNMRTKDEIEQFEDERELRRLENKRRKAAIEADIRDLDGKGPSKSERIDELMSHIKDREQLKAFMKSQRQRVADIFEVGQISEDERNETLEDFDRLEAQYLARLEGEA